MIQDVTGAALTGLKEGRKPFSLTQGSRLGLRSAGLTALRERH